MSEDKKDETELPESKKPPIPRPTPEQVPLMDVEIMTDTGRVYYIDHKGVSHSEPSWKRNKK